MAEKGSGGGKKPSRRSADMIDFSLLTEEQIDTWYEQLAEAQVRISGLPDTPVPLSALASVVGINQRLAEHVLGKRGGRIVKYVIFASAQPQLSPEEIEANYVTVEEAARMADASKSHVYVVIRDPSNEVRTTQLAGISFIHKDDVEKLRRVRG